MAIDLWNDVSQRVGRASTLVEFQTYSDLISGVATGEVDATVTNLTITERRAKRVDFTHPWFDAGMRDMVHAESQSSFGAFVAALSHAGHPATYAWIGFIILMSTLVLTLFDRQFDGSFRRR